MQLKPGYLLKSFLLYKIFFGEPFFSTRKWNLPNPIDTIWAISEIFENINALFCQELTKYQSKLLIAHHVAINYLSCSVELPKLACAFHWKFFSSPNGATALLKSHVCNTPPRLSEISKKNWRIKVKPFAKLHSWYKVMLEVKIRS